MPAKSAARSWWCRNLSPEQFQVVPYGFRLGVIPAQKMLEYLQSPLVTLLGAVQVAQVLQDPAEVVDISGHVGMVGTVYILADFKSQRIPARRATYAIMLV